MKQNSFLKWFLAAVGFSSGFLLKIPDNLEFLNKVDEVRFIASLNVKLSNQETSASNTAGEKDKPE